MPDSRNSLRLDAEYGDGDGLDALFDELPPKPCSSSPSFSVPNPDHSSDMPHAATSHSQSTMTATLDTIHTSPAGVRVKPANDDDTRLAVAAATLSSPVFKPFYTSVDGLYFYPELLLDPTFAQRTFSRCMDTFFYSPNVNQVMLFGRTDSPATTSLPDFLQELLDVVCSLLRPALPANVHDLLFSPPVPRSRQAIINLYHPGEGISSHVDLLTRYDDGIVGVSLGSGCVMHFSRTANSSIPSGPENCCMTKRLYEEIYLPAGSFIALSGEARYLWKHGIDAVPVDLVSISDGKEEWIERQTRISVTFRWLLPGADVYFVQRNRKSEVVHLSRAIWVMASAEAAELVKRLR